MMKKTIKKRGELTTQQIVMLIILIVGFVIILFLLFRLNLGRTTDKEICHNSVVLKGRTKIAGPLNCKTNYLCISSGDKCEGITPTTTVDVDSKEDIMKAIADEMSDCWWMFGEGEIDYKEVGKYHCAICSIVKFDQKIQTEFGEISYTEFYNYLKDNLKDETQTYLIYLYGFFDVNSIKEMNEKIDIDSELIYTEEKYAIVTGINPELLRPNKFLNPYFVKSNEIKDKTKCEVFDISKA